MKKHSKARLVIGLCGALLTSSIIADDDRDKYREQHQIHIEMMQMFRETLQILHGLNHTPTKEEQKRINEMIRRLEDMTRRYDDMDRMRDRDHMRDMDHRKDMDHRRDMDNRGWRRDDRE